MKTRVRWLTVVIMVFLAAAPFAAARAAEPIKRPRYIAVVGFRNLRPGTDTDWIGEGAAETLTTKLAGVPGLVAIERSQIKKVIEEQDLQQSDLVDTKTALKVGKLVGAERIVIGTHVAQGESILFNVRVVDVKTAVVLNAAGVTGTKQNVFDLLFQLAEAVVESFDKKVVTVDARPTAQQAPVAERIVLTEEQKRLLREHGTTNPAAYEAFSKAVAAADLDEEIRLYGQAIRLDPKYAWAYLNRGVTYSEKDDYDRAIADCDRAIQLKPDDADAYRMRGTIYTLKGDHYSEKGDYDRAIADYDRAIRLKPDDADAYKARGIIYALKGDHDRAKADMENCRALGGKPSPRLLELLRNLSGRSD